ncbi:helix-turn-helix domain-containing protein [Bacteriovorax sp. PP10]|uniref:Helix-turn-helix domain-containing protein n=1 Tax=Bacteriovorax antarcticus TaxID=3088717 RepID=A0ABU5VUC2_9BACT|nr:helix-turn-helix domain-containing protein [Bacteriovorax sp. PP10]MEA9355964.1 helix-turn-helix domain-containing protein [Bacteriovorax sp. PP10]
MSNKLSKTDSWAILLITYNRVIKAIEKELKDHNFPNLEWYDVLWALERSADGKLRFNELGEKIDLAKYNVSRLAEKLSKEGLIRIESSLEDKRGLFAVITAKGLKTRMNIWQVYESAILKNFGSKLTNEEHLQLKKILLKI